MSNMSNALSEPVLDALAHYGDNNTNYGWAGLRIQTCDRLIEWGVSDGVTAGYLHLTHLFGYQGGLLRFNFTAKDAAVCELLCGPHGYTIYKALLARKESSNAL